MTNTHVDKYVYGGAIVLGSPMILESTCEYLVGYVISMVLESNDSTGIGRLPWC